MNRRLIVLPVALVLCLAQAAWCETPRTWLDANLNDLVALYRHFHAHPELSFEERETAARLAKEFRAVGAKVAEQVGGHGVVGVLANGAGPTLMLRADMDGLPVAEETGLEYASQVRTKNERGATVGVMHACGHDVHLTNLVGVARYLAAHRDSWRGTLLLVGQPAEERGAGAKAMLAAGLFRNYPRPDFALALHVDASSAAGTVGYLGGYALANVDSVDITIRGRGGHGAYPHTTIDPIVIAARLVLDLQTIVSREVKPIEPAVVTVGSIQAGTKHNVISSECRLQLTVRSYAGQVRQQLHEAIRRKTLAAAASAAAPEPEINISEGTPALWNDPELAERLGQVFRRELGQQNVIQAEPSMGGEDFGRYGRAGVPILMYRVGAVASDRLARYTKAGEQPPSLHSAHFYPDAEPTLRTSVSTMAAAALELLAKRVKKRVATD